MRLVISLSGMVKFSLIVFIVGAAFGINLTKAAPDGALNVLCSGAAAPGSPGLEEVVCRRHIQAYQNSPWSIHCWSKTIHLGLSGQQAGPARPVEGNSMSEHVLPFYVVCDESYSMADHLDTLNAELRGLHHAVMTDHQVAARSWLCLIGFSRTARVLTPLSRLAELTEITGLTAGAATNYSAAFALLRDTIESDVDVLNSQAHTVYRPVVFFLSDGQPTDPASWRAAHARLVDRSWPARPHIIAFGIGDADPRTIRVVGTFKAFMSQDGMTPGKAIREFASTLTSSIVMSGRSTAQAQEMGPHIPEQASGFTPIYASHG